MAKVNFGKIMFEMSGTGYFKVMTYEVLPWVT